jgi:hypothetical protein
MRFPANENFPGASSPLLRQQCAASLARRAQWPLGVPTHCAASLPARSPAQRVAFSLDKL